MLRKQLLDSSRGQLVTLLQRGGLTAEDMASKLGVTTNAVREHLAGMERDGVVGRTGRRPGTTRPSRVFELTADVEQLLSHPGLLFPNQDTMPQGGFGNLIALPLQKGLRDQSNSVFVDDDLRPWADQWAFLATGRSADPTSNRSCKTRNAAAACSVSVFLRRTTATPSRGRLRHHALVQTDCLAISRNRSNSKAFGFKL